MIPGIIAATTGTGNPTTPAGPALLELDFVNEAYYYNEVAVPIGNLLRGDVNVIYLDGLQFDTADLWTPCVFTEEAMDIINANGLVTISIDMEPLADFYTPIHMRTSATETYGTLELEFYPYYHDNTLCDVVLIADGDDSSQMDIVTGMDSIDPQQFSATLGTDNPGAAFGTGWTGVTSQYWGTATPPFYQWETITLGGSPDFPNPQFKGKIKRIRIWAATLDVFDVIPA